MVLAILSNVSLHGFLKKVPSWDHFYLDPGINWDMVKPPMDGIWCSPIFIGYVSIIFLEDGFGGLHICLRRSIQTIQTKDAWGSFWAFGQAYKIEKQAIFGIPPSFPP
jgi:hypothetical protein